jgi:hypothetical protein
MYNDMIEIYDTESELTLQMNIKSYTNTTLRILMPRIAKRSTKDKRNTLTPKFFAKCEYSFKLYKWLISAENISLVNKYLEDLELLKTQPQYKMLVASLETFLEDTKNKNKATYTNADWYIMQMCHENVVERNTIHFSSKNSLLRIYRKIKYMNSNDENEYCLRPYSIPKKTNLAAKWLINYGFITFSTIDDKLNQKTFENLAKGNVVNEAKLFMRLPIIDSSYIFKQANNEIELLNDEINQAINNDYLIEYEDTRIWSKSYPETISTYFEIMKYLYEPEEFKQTRELLENEKIRSINSFINNYYDLIHLIDTVVEKSANKK